MNRDDDVRREIDEEDEIRRLLHRRQRTPVPPFETVMARARSGGMSSRLIGAVAVAALLVAVAIGVSRQGALPVAASASPAPTLDCALPSSLELARHVTSSDLITSISSVELSDPQTNQMRWVLRFLSTREASGSTTVAMRVRITASGAPLHVLGYGRGELPLPQDAETVVVAPCKDAELVVRTAGPLLDGTWPYEVTIEKITLPDARTVSETISVPLVCSNAQFTCSRVIAGTTPAPTATPDAAVLKPAFGVVYWGTQQGFAPETAPKIRREGDADRVVAQLAGSFFNQFHGAVSPDGRRAVYPAQAEDGKWSLYLFDGARPTERRRLLDLPDEIPGQIAWASDGTAVAFGVTDAGATQGVTPKYEALRTLDLATGKVNELARVTDGSYYYILGWDRPANTIAFVAQPNGVETTKSYIVIGPSGTRSVPVDAPWAMLGSPDARTVAGVRCTGNRTGCSLWTWPLADFASRTERIAASNSSLSVFAWRPGNADLGLMVADLPAGEAHVELWSASSGRRTVYRFAAGRTPPGPMFFRADGSALFVPGYGEAVVVDLASGRTSPLPFPAPTGPYDKPFISASIRLD